MRYICNALSVTRAMIGHPPIQQRPLLGRLPIVPSEVREAQVAIFALEPSCRPHRRGEALNFVVNKRLGDRERFPEMLCSSARSKAASVSQGLRPGRFSVALGRHRLRFVGSRLFHFDPVLGH